MLPYPYEAGLLALALLSTGCRLVPGSELEEPFAVRSQLLGDTGTTPDGEVEVEAAWVAEPFDAMEAQASLLYGLGPATEFSLGVTPYVDLEEGGDGMGDTTLGLRYRFRGQDQRGRPSLALALEGKLPTAEEGLGSGEVDLFTGLVGTRAWDDNWIWWGYRAGFLGEPDGPGLDLEHALVIGGARQLTPGIGSFAEVDWTECGELDQSAGSVRIGGVLAVADGWLLDLGMSIGFGRDASDERLMIGLTRGMGRAPR